MLSPPRRVKTPWLTPWLAFQRAYFEVPDLPGALAYRVFVWDYTYRQS